jgi:hypothetical protein
MSLVPPSATIRRHSPTRPAAPHNETNNNGGNGGAAADDPGQVFLNEVAGLFDHLHRLAINNRDRRSGGASSSAARGLNRGNPRQRLLKSQRDGDPRRGPLVGAVLWCGLTGSDGR